MSVGTIAAARRRTGSAPQVLPLTLTPSGGVIDVQNVDFTGYQRIIVLLDGIIPSAANVNLLLRFYVAGVLQTAGGYSWYTRIGDLPSSSVIDGADYIRLTAQSDNATNASLQGRFEISNLVSTLEKQVMFDLTLMDDAGAVLTERGFGMLNNSGTVNGLRIYAHSTNNIVSGTCHIYGI